ncbi:MAG: metallophosphoesterase, partial [Burkholderiales bacterium]|nr:metallophosphoesterase [Burkholderiales bacterium]
MKAYISLASFAWLFLFSIACSGQPLPTPSTQELLILHTNDLHTHFAGTDKHGNACNTEENCQGGYGQIAELIKKFKEDNPNVLVLDAGDRLQGSLAYSINKWPGAKEFEKYLQLDVATLGNHEYDEGCEELSKYIRNSNYKVVAANVKIGEVGELKPADVVPYEIRQYGNMKIGIVGLASDVLSKTSPSCNNLSFLPPIQAAQKAIDNLKKQGVSLIIVISHLGIERDIELGRALKGANIIVGGHSHKYIGEGSSIGPYPFILKEADGKPVLMVTTNGLARFLGELRIKYDQNGDLLSWEGMPIYLGKAGGEKEITDLIQKNYKEVKEMLETPLFTNQVDTKDGFDACRHGFCLTASLMADVIKEYGKDKG